jgi:hypothetical protein
MDDTVAEILRDHADALCYKVTPTPPVCACFSCPVFHILIQDADQKPVPPKAFFAGGVNPSGIPIFFVAFAPPTTPPGPCRSHLTQVVLSALQRSSIKAVDAEAAVPFAPLNLMGRSY